MRAALLVNRNAWRNERPGERDALRAAFGGLGEVAETTDIRELPALLGRWRDQGVDLLAVSGGDGTLHHVVNATRQTWGNEPMPRLLPLNGGTAGFVAGSVAPGRQVERMRTVREAIERGEDVAHHSIPTLEVQGRACFNVGLGIFADISAEISSGRHGRGSVAMGLAATRAVLGGVIGSGYFAREVLRGWRGTLQWEGGPAERIPLLGLYASAMDHNALGPARGFYAGPRTSSTFRVLVIATSPRAAAVRLLPFALGRGAFEGISIPVTRRLVLTPDEPSTYVTDGEIIPFEGPLALDLGASVTLVGRPA